MIVQQFDKISLLEEYQTLKESIITKLNAYFSKLEKIIEEFSQPINESIKEQIKLISNYESPIERIFQQKLLDKEQVQGYLNYVEKCSINNIDQLEASLNFIRVDGGIGKIQKEMDILYIEQMQEPQKQSSGTLEEIEFNLNLPHKLIEYEEHFNPQYICITSCIISFQNEFITGGWDGKIVRFDMNEIKQELKLFNNPVKIIKQLRNNCFFIVNDSDEYKLLDEGWKILREDKLGEMNIINIDEYVQETHHVIKIRVDNGDQYIGNVKDAFLNGFRHLKMEDTVHKGNVITTYFDDIIVVDQFDNFGNVLIYSVDSSNHIISTNQFKISDALITKALILNDDQYYFRDIQNRLYLYDAQLESEYDDVISHYNNLVMIKEDKLKINEMEYPNKLTKILDLAMGSK
ncbi:unnamed protein product (macronuclear) [Paramecium tetraurelia]|uniref:Uncharacterized protein n=1 Tax=Paramecium tetraurelia TaxID=5888 RepID=A0EHS1_PARTE|nr:uncharacterized protein GSPATT00027188001 [Paramecium tetraurelia]CAK94862.1 unnamed protein product [Paramecium tetraurelia]|eukprot:XP_001462235.1 hypothetical protein (macronuclear) [Paramecium tetraurelia strain d4-2]